MLTPNAEAVLERRYYHPNENWERLCMRVAYNISQAEHKYGGDGHEWMVKFYDAMHGLKFLPNSPTLMNAGGQLQQLSACFVLPVHDDTESIFESAKQAAIIHKTGGGTGFDFSELRPAASYVGSTGGVASGPCSFIDVYDAATGAMKQGGTRRGANMAILRCDHPDILEFVHSKFDSRRYTNFNISVGITDDFIEAMKNDGMWDLKHPKTGVAATIKARTLWWEIAEAAHKCGDPGLVFLDRMNQTHPNGFAGTLRATNPCGEQPLLPFESCNLGSVNLAQFVKDGGVDWEQLGYHIQLLVRFLDDVIDMNRYPIPEIERATKLTRRIGVGVMGWADMLVQMKIKYDSYPALQLARELSQFFHEQTEDASLALTWDRGEYPGWEDSDNAIALRNTDPTTIAPTGTISIIAGTSSGIEPYYDRTFTRTVMDGTVLVEDLGDDPFVRIASEIEPHWHVQMQAAWQEGIHNAVSKTVNMPHETTIEEVEGVYRLAYELGCKGITIYRDGSRESQVLRSGVDAHSPDQHGDDCDT